MSQTECSDLPQASWRRWGGQLYCVVCRFSSKDQDGLWRVLVSLVFSAIGSIVGAPAARAIQEDNTPHDDPGRIITRFFQTTCAFLLLFMMQKLDSVTRSVGKVPGGITIVDILGLSLELQQDDFRSWEVRTMVIPLLQHLMPYVDCTPLYSARLSPGAASRPFLRRTSPILCRKQRSIGHH